MPKLIGDGIKCEVVFPMAPNFLDLVKSIHDQAFYLIVNKEEMTCSLNQDGKPIKISFPDADMSPPLIFMNIIVYGELENILKIKKSNNLTLKIV